MEKKTTFKRFFTGPKTLGDLVACYLQNTPFFALFAEGSELLETLRQLPTQEQRQQLYVRETEKAYEKCGGEDYPLIYDVYPEEKFGDYYFTDEFLTLLGF